MRVKNLTAIGIALALTAVVEAALLMPVSAQSGVGPGFGNLNGMDNTFGRSSPSQQEHREQNDTDDPASGGVFWDLLEKYIEANRGSDEQRRTLPQARNTPLTAAPTWRAYGALNMRAAPRLNAPVLAEIPPESGGIRIEGCRQEASTGETWTWKGAVDGPRLWCLAQYAGQRGWVSAKYLVREQ